jgi:DNA-binding beta-propeller fold protein YncE
MRQRSIALFLSVTLAVRAAAGQTTPDCNQAAAKPITHVSVDGSPFEPSVTPDGCWIFVTVVDPGKRGNPGVTVLKRSGGKISVVRTIPLAGGPTGAVLTHDGTTLIVTTGATIAFLDAARMESGKGNAVLGVMDTHKPIGTINVNVTRDDKFVFVAAERAGGLLVIDMDKARQNTFGTSAIVGEIPTGNAPIAVTFSNDEQFLYSTAEGAPPALHWPIACRPEANAAAAPNHAQGAVFVIDVARAKTDPAHAVLSVVPAGCSPVRLVTSPDGLTAYVTTRGENQLYVFDAEKLRTDTAHALIGRVPVGTAPVGVAVIDSGARLVLTNSNRFGGGANDKQSLTVIDATKVTAGAAAVLGSIPAGAFPRELRVTADGHTLLATNFSSKTVELIDLRRLQLEPVKR